MLRLIQTDQIDEYPQQWIDLPHGADYQQALQKQIDPWLTKIFGFHLLKLGQLSIELDTQRCPIHHQINMANAGQNLHVRADHQHLPLAHKTIDACLLAHLLPFEHNPYQILREVDRILVDDGWLILSSFNLFSVLGLGKLVPVLKSTLPYSSNMFTELRLLDWLALLNYEVLYHSNFQVLPKHSHIESFLTTHFPVLGCLNVIIARKRTIPLTLDPLQKHKLRLHFGRKITGTVNTYDQCKTNDRYKKQ